MYIIDIPTEVKEQIKQILNKESRPKHKEMKYLCEVYFRYLRINVDVDEEVDFAMSCGNCQSKVLNRFKMMKRKGEL